MFSLETFVAYREGTAKATRLYWSVMRKALCLVGVLAVVAIGQADSVLGAGEIVLTTSPPDPQVGQPVEVLLRTFVPYPATAFGLASPRPEYPGSVGTLDVLYPWDDYPFNVRAEIAGETVVVPLTRDLQDSTLWRGSWTPRKVGTWTIRSYNFTRGDPGANTTVRVIEARPVGATDSGVLTGVGLLGLAGGLLLGFVIARRSGRAGGPGQGTRAL